MKRDNVNRMIYRAAAILIAAVLLIFSYFRSFDEFELNTLDFRFRIRPAQPVAKNIVIVHIGDDTIEKLGEWPLPRKYHALLVQALAAAKVKTVVFDVFFSEKTPDDEEFAKAVKDAGNVYIPYVFEIGPNVKGEKVIHASRFSAPLVDTLGEACKEQGFVNIVPDIDGKVRRVIPYMSYKGVLYPHITLVAALNDMGHSLKDVAFVPEKKLAVGEGLVIPLEEHSNILVNYPGKWGKDFRHYSYVDIIQSYLSSMLGKEPLVDLKELEGSTCFVGFTATAAPDAHPSPLEPLYPGIGVHASFYNSIVTKNFIQRLDRSWNILILFLLWVITYFVTEGSRKRLAFFSIIIIVLSYTALATVLFCFGKLWIDLFYPLVTVIGIYAAFTVKKYIVEIEKRELLEKELDIAKGIQESFLPKEIPQTGGLEINARMLTAHQVGGDLYDVIPFDEKHVGVMIGDVSGKGVPAALFMAQVVSVFKSFARPEKPGEVLKQMNDRIVAEGRSNLFVTLTYTVFDTKRKTAKFAIGGHLPTVFIKPNGEVELLKVEEGMPLGLIEGEFCENEIKYEPASVFVFYTDGVTEAMNTRNEMYGEERLVELAKKLKGLSAKEVVEAVHKSVADFAGRAKQHDDITVVAVKT